MSEGRTITRFEDLIAMNALYRPGPMESGMHDDYVRRKHGESKVEYPLPQLEPILKETYGVILYQEQVMQIAQAVAGYSLGEADMLRRAMGKKDFATAALLVPIHPEMPAKQGQYEDFMPPIRGRDRPAPRSRVHGG